MTQTDDKSGSALSGFDRVYGHLIAETTVRRRESAIVVFLTP